MPCQGDVQDTWRLLRKLNEKVWERHKCNKTTRENCSDSINRSEGPNPAHMLSTAETPVNTNRSNAGLKGEEWLRALTALWKHFPYQQFHSPFALPFGVGFFPSSLSCNLWSFSYFSWMLWKAEVAFSFSCLQNSLKYFRAGANQSRGVTTTSQMREIRVFSISLKK